MTFAPDLFAGQVVAITGGATGIGFRIAEAFGRLGARLVLASRKADPLERAVASLADQGIDALGVPTDVRDPAAADALAARIRRAGPGLDVLVLSHGANFVCPALAMTPNGFRAVVDTLLHGTFHCCRSLAPLMVERGRGRIVSIAATNAQGGSPLMAHSGAGKAGILSLTESLAVELGPAGITVNTVSPGPVATDAANARLWPEDSAAAAVARATPLGGRMATADDVVGAVLFLASPAAAFVTGADLVIDGGNRLRQVPALFGR